jgi:hypothetical protein
MIDTRIKNLLASLVIVLLFEISLSTFQYLELEVAFKSWLSSLVAMILYIKASELSGFTKSVKPLIYTYVNGLRQLVAVMMVVIPLGVFLLIAAKTTTIRVIMFASVFCSIIVYDFVAVIRGMYGDTLP